MRGALLTSRGSAGMVRRTDRSPARPRETPMSVAPRTAAPRPLATGAARRPRSEIRALTGLRIVAAMWVVLYHYEPELMPYVDQLPGVHAVLSAGWIGVELFFVLSGFVIARSYLDECGRRWSTAGAARFVVNRVARVWPAWMAVTVVACAWLVVCPRLGLNPNVVSGHPALVMRPFLRVHPAANLCLATAAMSPLALTSFLHGTDDIEMNWVLRIACSFVAGVLASCAVTDLEAGEKGGA